MSKWIELPNKRFQKHPFKIDSLLPIDFAWFHRPERPERPERRSSWRWENTGLCIELWGLANLLHFHVCSPQVNAVDAWSIFTRQVVQQSTYFTIDHVRHFLEKSPMFFQPLLRFGFFRRKCSWFSCKHVACQTDPLISHSLESRVNYELIKKILAIILY